MCLHIIGRRRNAVVIFETGDSDDAAMAAFSSFINEENLNAQQIFFVQQVISHVENNGYMEDPGVLLRAPFDRPVPFFRLFNEGQQQRLVAKIREIRENAVVA